MKSVFFSSFRWCGAEVPAQISSSQDTVLVRFVSDYSVAHNGFRLEWVVEGCGGRLTKPSGVISSPNYPHVYPNSISCIWHIDQELGTSIELNITDYYLEQDRGPSRDFNCVYDHLTVWGGPDKTSPQLTQLCNRRASATVVTALGNQMLVEFKSDGSVQGKGFTATYRVKQDGCGGIVKGKNGVIMSPNYPNNYNQNDDCGWLLEVDNNHVVQFQFVDFDVEPHSNCSYDYVALYDGNSIDAPLLLLHCGRELPSPAIISSTGKQMYVRMKADGSIASKGFKANFTRGCGATIVTEGEGVLTSPDYPGRWLHGQSCEWVIQGSRGEDRVSLQINMLDLPGDSTNCTDEEGYMEVRDGPDVMAPVIGRYCGHTLPHHITSHGSGLHISLHRGHDYYDSITSSFRFRAIYRVSSAGCGGSLTSNSGRFSSPGYPESPPPGAACEWTISASPGNLVSLNVEMIDLEESDNCNADYLDVYKQGPDGEHIGRYCGSTIPGNITTANSLWVKFNAAGGGVGSASDRFVASYNLLHNNALFGPSGQISSPHYPLLMFGESWSYQWSVTVSEGKAVQINFEEMDLEVDSYDCYTSRITIYDGSTDSGQVLFSGCELGEEANIQSSSNMVFITFEGEYLIAGAKFLLSWREVPRRHALTPASGGNSTECGGEIMLDARGNVTYLRSPGWPHSYEHNLMCEWIIRAPFGMRIQFAIQSLRLEVHRYCRYDRLSVFDGLYGTEQWNKTGDYCSRRQTRVLLSSGPVMKAVFKTDHSISSRGFQVALRALCGGFISVDGRGGGTLASPGSPDNYPPDSHCQWVVRTGPAKALEFQFTILDLPSSGSDCADDYLILRNGGRSTSPLFLINPGQNEAQNGHLCGSTLPAKKSTSSNHLMVTFRFPPTPLLMPSSIVFVQV